MLNNLLITSNNTTNDETDTSNYKRITKTENKIQNALITNNNTRLKTINERSEPHNSKLTNGSNIKIPRYLL